MKLTRRHAIAFGVFAVGTGLLVYVTRDGDAVDIELPKSGRALTNTELSGLRAIAESTFHDARGLLDGLPARLTLIVRWGKEVVPGTGSNGTASFPGNVALTLDPEGDVPHIIERELRSTLTHELHHLARASRVVDATLVDRVITEGLATVFERDTCKTEPPWGAPPPETWTSEVLALPADTEPGPWMHRHPDGREWVGMRVGTLLVDRAARAMRKTAAQLVFASSDEIVHAADRR